jgi:parvulin-like peptidyl-prolyl isomerase
LLLATAAHAELLDGVTVIVNESIITYDEVQRDLEGMARTMAMNYPNDVRAFNEAMTSNRVDIVRDKVNARLILDDFKTKMNGGDIPESILDDEVRAELRKTYNGNRALMTKTLHDQGVTAEMFRDRIREHMIVAYMRDKAISNDKIIISPQKIEDYYTAHQDQFKIGDQVKLRMITLPKPADSPDAARKIAEEIIRKIDGGAPFSEMASIYSSGPERNKGGDRGWVGRDSGMQQDLVKAMFSLKAGQHSAIIELPESVHILYAEEAKPAHIRPLTEARDEIQQKLRTDQAHRLFDKWVARLRSKAFVRYVD